MTTLRKLGPGDAEGFREIRLAALLEAPEAFLSSYEEEQADDVESFRERLTRSATDPAYFVLGAFDEDVLVGMFGAARDRFEKARHRVVLWGMWVRPGARRRGIGASLVATMLDTLAAIGDVEQARLSVVVGNESARRLYEAAGFTVWGVEPAAMKVNGRPLDEAHMVRVLR